MPDLTLEHAHRIVVQGRAAAQDAGLNAVFALLDAGAHLVTFSRMDGAWLASNELAIAKARTSVMFQMPSEALNAPLQVGQPLAHFDHVHAGGLLLMGGGLPLFGDDGVLIGALGVSGGTPEQDAALARAATA
ncbi:MULTISPECIES: heme-binding protein [unclassified Variovorax]|uniref:GlcG/HbpS family heme-binding protein n=1 Tax=unclassified Variovorax TaxID=663243 RepID=UPI0025787E38|nr:MULTISPECIES: heme-binding protein [unclassified Variovorax]MDM0089278.1 heme-binding protein [Variovorax sp. J22G40]MDM0147351.1 heme-binding protein [Variovorax sp. J2P1-31]